jgi:hypothetical protein
MFWCVFGGGIGRAEVRIKGKKLKKGKGKERENMPKAHLDASIPTENVPVFLRKKHV